MVQFNTTLRCYQLFNGAYFLLSEHCLLLSFVLRIVVLGQEAHQKLVASQDPAAEHVLRKA